MDHIFEICTRDNPYTSTLISPVYDTEQISISEVKFPLVQPLVTDLEFEDGTICYASSASGSTEIDKVSSILLPNGYSISDEGNDSWKITGPGSDEFTLLENSFLGGGTSTGSELIVYPNYNGPTLFVSLGDGEEKWRGKLGNVGMILSDALQGEILSDTLVTNVTYYFKNYVKKTVREIDVEILFKNNGKYEQYNFKGHEWGMKIVLHGNIDRNNSQMPKEHQEDVTSSSMSPDHWLQSVRRRVNNDIIISVLAILFVIVLISMFKPKQHR